jgi:hypothetical protein
VKGSGAWGWPAKSIWIVGTYDELFVNVVENHVPGVPYVHPLHGDRHGVPHTTGNTVGRKP